MARMKRKQLYFDAEHDAKVKRLAESQGITESDVVRAAIEALPAPTAQGSRVVHRDPQAWSRARDFIRALAERPARPGAPASRRWTRDELYEDRIPRSLR